MWKSAGAWGWCGENVPFGAHVLYSGHAGDDVLESGLSPYSTSPITTVVVLR